MFSRKEIIIWIFAAVVGMTLAYACRLEAGEWNEKPVMCASEEETYKTINEKEDTSEVESNNKDDSNIKNIAKDDVEENDSQLEDLIKERDELKDKLMRALAESENIRKRSFKDRQDAEIYAVSKMSRDILSVFDNLQRALDLADDILDEKSLPMIEGLELTKKELLEVCLLYTSPSPRDMRRSRMPSSA